MGMIGDAHVSCASAMYPYQLCSVRLALSGVMKRY